MRLLALDCSLSACSTAVAIEDGGAVRVSAVQKEIGKGHAERILPLIDAALNGAGIRIRDIDRIAVTTGPGSFTGIRVGLAAARGLALVLNVPAIGISTLRALAADAEPLAAGRPLLAAMDARRGEVYVQTFRGGQAVAEPVVLPLEQVARDLSRAEEVALAGSGAEVLAREAAKHGRRAEIVSTACVPSIEGLARLGLALDPAAHPPLPCYIRAPDVRPQTAARPAA